MKKPKSVYETSDAWKTVMAIKNAEREVVRASGSFVRYLYTRPRHTNRYYARWCRLANTAQNRLIGAIARLERARAADRKRKKS
jgi:hypothetical protein